MLEKGSAVAQCAAIDLGKQGVPLAELGLNGGVVGDGVVKRTEAAETGVEDGAVLAEADDNVAAGGREALAGEENLVQMPERMERLVRFEDEAADEADARLLRLVEIDFKAQAVGDKAEVVERVALGLEVFLQLDPRVVALTVEVGLDLDDEVTPEGINAPAHLGGLDFALQLDLGALDAEGFAEEVQEQGAALVVGPFFSMTPRSRPQ